MYRKLSQPSLRKQLDENVLRVLKLIITNDEGDKRTEGGEIKEESEPSAATFETRQYPETPEFPNPPNSLRSFTRF